MKTSFLFVFFLMFLLPVSQGQSPVALRPDISITLVEGVAPGANRLCYNTLDSSLYYCNLDGNIYKVNMPVSGTATDTLLYTVADHGIPFVQGMEMRDSVLYVSGNLDKDSALTTGIIMRGVLQSGYQRLWSVVAQTVPYETTGNFDHLFSGLTLNQSGDTLLQCSGSRGDHGEVSTRGGLFPGLRNLPMTAVILQIPASAQGLVIPKDSAGLAAMGLVFAHGIRNTYDFSYNAFGELFGCDNSGDRDVEDELNLISKGGHYGFPWRMGGTENPQQYPGYDPATDLLINHNCKAWNDTLFTDDSLFPPVPPGIVMIEPCLNLGPDASFMRDSLTGSIYNAALTGQVVRSFTPHRSPLGMTFDNDSILGSDLRGSAFVLSFTRGDTSLASASPLLSPFQDAGEDLLMLQMEKDTASGNYRFHAIRIVEKFRNPIDAVLLDTNLYVIEFGYGNSKSIWRLGLPRYASGPGAIPEEDFEKHVLVYPNPAGAYARFVWNKAMSYTKYDLEVFNSMGSLVNHEPGIISGNGYTLDTRRLKSGIYGWRLTGENGRSQTGRLAVIH